MPNRYDAPHTAAPYLLRSQGRFGAFIRSEFFAPNSVSEAAANALSGLLSICAHTDRSLEAISAVVRSEITDSRPSSGLQCLVSSFDSLHPRSSQSHAQFPLPPVEPQHVQFLDRAVDTIARMIHAEYGSREPSLTAPYPYERVGIEALFRFSRNGWGLRFDESLLVNLSATAFQDRRYLRLVFESTALDLVGDTSLSNLRLYSGEHWCNFLPAQRGIILWTTCRSFRYLLTTQGAWFKFAANSLHSCGLLDAAAPNLPPDLLPFCCETSSADRRVRDAFLAAIRRQADESGGFNVVDGSRLTTPLSRRVGMTRSQCNSFFDMLPDFAEFVRDHCAPLPRNWRELDEACCAERGITMPPPPLRPWNWSRIHPTVAAIMEHDLTNHEEEPQ